MMFSKRHFAVAATMSALFAPLIRLCGSANAKTSNDSSGMRITYHKAFGVAVTVYFMNAGDKIAMHTHAVMHTTGCAAGKSEVEIEGEAPFQMVSGVPDFDLPANIPHEIRAIEDGTVIVNLISGGDGTISADGGGPTHGGVMLVDGTIVYD